MKGNLVNDLFASTVVFLVALPLCIGIAVAVGVPPAMGLVSGIIGGILVGYFAGSPLQVSGPAAGLVVICVEVIHDFGMAALPVCILLAGVLQLAAGFTGVANWFRAVAPAVIYAMLFGIGVLIFASQFHVMVDDTPAANGVENIITIPSAIWKGLIGGQPDPHHLAARIGALTLAILVGWNWLGKKLPGPLSLIPGPLIAVGVATGVATAMSLPIAYIEAPTTLFKLPEVSSFSLLTNPAVLAAAVAMALIASAESLLCASAVDKLHSGPRTDFDKELRAQGIGNIAAGILGGLPITGVIVRSTANVDAGGTSRWSGVIHGFWLLIAVLAAPGLLGYIPKAALAGVLVYIGWKLMNFQVVRELAGKSRADLAIFALTVVLIVAINLLEGLLIGLALSVLKLAWTLSNLEVNKTERRGDDGRLIIDLDLHGTATFVGLPNLARELEEAPLDAEIHVHLEHLSYIDHACLDLLSDWGSQLEANGGSLVVEWQELVDRQQRPRARPAA